MNTRHLIYTTSLIALVGGGLAFFMMPERSEASEAYCRQLAKPESYSAPGLEQYNMLIPGKDGWIFRTENDFRSDFTINDRTKNYLLSLQQAFKAKNAELVIVYPPVRAMVHSDKLSGKHKRMFGMKNPEAVWDNYEAMIAGLENAGVNIVGLNRNEVGPDYFYKRNHHWSPAGSRITAHKVAAKVKQLELYQDVPKKQFTSIAGNPAPYKSSFEKAFIKVCGTELPPELVTEYTTAESAATLTEQSLFNETEQAKVVLLGTSNSVDESSMANFEGFLKEELSADVHNVAFIGAGIDTSIISYLNSEAFKKGNPRVVIWEVPGYYDLNIMDDKLFQQIIPAVYGACNADPVVTKTASLPPGRNVVFDLNAPASPTMASLGTGLPAPQSDLSILRDPGSKYYLKLSFSQPVKEKFSLQFQYHENGTKKQEFRRSSRYPHDNEFYALFPSTASNADLETIALEMPQDMKDLSAEIQICTVPGTAKTVEAIN